MLGGVEGSEAKSLDAGEDIIGCFGPAERLGRVVGRRDVVFDGAFEFAG